MAKASTATTPATSQSTQDQLRTIIERIERLEEEKAALGEDISAVLNEAKSNGYDTKAIRQVIKIRKKPQEHEELQHIVDLYKHALGMI